MKKYSVPDALFGFGAHFRIDKSKPSGYDGLKCYANVSKNALIPFL